MIHALLVLAGAALTEVPTPIKPSDTDKGIVEFNDPHLVYRNSKAKPRNELLIFIPGTGGRPGGTGMFCQTAADLGYHTIALAYPSSVPATAARADQDKKAMENFRWEIIEGGDLSPHVSVDRLNSIESRLALALKHLHKTEPKGAWAQFLDKKGLPNWSKIAVTGHSQGGGHAALIAKKHRVARVIMTGAPKDFDRVRNSPAAWLSGPFATPMKAFFAFNHELDRQGCTIAEQLRVFTAMGLDKVGAAVSVDKEKAPFKHSRILLTNFDGSPTDSPRAHSTVIGDGITPKDAKGQPVFRSVWTYMMTEPTK